MRSLYSRSFLQPSQMRLERQGETDDMEREKMKQNEAEFREIVYRRERERELIQRSKRRES